MKLQLVRMCLLVLAFLLSWIDGVYAQRNGRSKTALFHQQQTRSKSVHTLQYHSKPKPAVLIQKPVSRPKISSNAAFRANKKQVTAPKTYQVYIRKDGYIGRTSGNGMPKSNVKRRNATHHRNKVNDNNSKHRLLLSSTNKHAIRGAEEILLRRQRAKGKKVNKINGISKKNPKLNYYLEQAYKEFGLKL